MRGALALLGVGGFVSGVSIRMAEPLIPNVAEDLGIAIRDAGGLVTGFALAYGLFQLVHGPLGDRYGKLRVVSAALVLAGLACWACAGAATLDELLVWRFATGMTAGAVIPLSFAYIGDEVPFESRHAVLGRFISGALLGQSCGPLVGGLLADLVGWRATFLVPAAAFAVLGLALLPSAVRERTAVDDRPPGGPFAVYASLARSSNARFICLVVAIEGGLFYGAFAYLGAYLRESYSLGFTTIGLVLATFGVGGIVYSIAVRALLSRLGTRAMAVLGGWLMLGGFAALAAAPGWALAPPCIAILGFGFYLMHNTLQTRATEMAPSARGSAIAAFAMCLFFGQAIGAWVGGIGIEAFGYPPVLASAGIGLAVLARWFSRTL